MMYYLLILLLPTFSWAYRDVFNEEIVSSSCPLEGLSLPENYSYDVPESQKGKPAISPLKKASATVAKKEMTLEERKLASPRAARRRRSTRDKASEMCEGCQPKVAIIPTKEKPKPIDDIHQHGGRGPGLFSSGAEEGTQGVRVNV